MAFLLLLPLLILFPAQSQSQQSYVKKEQLDCNQNHTSTLGFLCNAAPSCTSYLTFRSTPTYNNPATIAYLLAADASQIAAANNISDVDFLPDDTLVIVPVNCSCSNGYYQHNASYVLKRQGETYFDISNYTYQALTSCQAMEAQNPYNFRRLVPDMRLTAPLRCACPTPNQTAAGYNYLLTYLIRQGNSYNSIAASFAGAGADIQGILDANMLTEDQLIFFFSPILVPLKTMPTRENINTVDSRPPALAPPVLPTTPSSGDSSSRKWIFIGVGIGAAVFVMLCSAFLIWFLRYRRRKPPIPPPSLAGKFGDASMTKPLPSWSVSSEGLRSAIETLTIYKFEDLEKATNSFAESNRINGSSVYRGSFKGDDAVVKMMKGDVSREIDVLRQINHSHVVRLSGFCLHQGITHLVYEYAEKGSLTEWLQNKNSGGKHSANKRLDWKQRLQIACDVADALNYLHNFTNPPYIHKNLTSSNILLDSNTRAKVANFGLARTVGTDDQAALTRHVVGTYGYMAPEYVENGLITPKLDVFALGVVMLELLSGKEAIDAKAGDGKDAGDQVLLYQRIEGVMGGENVREKLREFMDPVLGGEYPLELAYSVCEIARRCVAHSLDARPPVTEVFMALTKFLAASLDWDPSHDTSVSFSE